MMNRNVGLIIAGVAVALIAAWLAYSGNPESEQTTDNVVEGEELANVTVRMKWVHQAQHAGFYIADQKGYYEAAGLVVTLEPGGTNFPAIQAVVTGGEDFGVTAADQILLARSQGADVVPLLVIYPQTPFVLFAREDSNIDSIDDIVGQRVGVKLGGNEEFTYRAMVASAGLDADAIEEVPVSVDMTLFLNGNVDVWPGYKINEPLVAEENGIPVVLFSPSELGIETYGDTLFTVRSLIEENPEVVARFVDATRQGWVYAIEHPEEAAEITMQYASGTTIEHQRAMMTASLPSLTLEGMPFGAMTLEGWSSTQQILIDGQFLAEPIDIDEMLAETTPD